MTPYAGFKALVLYGASWNWDHHYFMNVAIRRVGLLFVAVVFVNCRYYSEVEGRDSGLGSEYTSGLFFNFPEP